MAAAPRRGPFASALDEGVAASLRTEPDRALAKLDLVATQLLRRLTVVMVPGAVMTTLLAHDVPGDWDSRALVGTAVITTRAAVAWLTLRHLPAGARLHLRGLRRRLASESDVWVVMRFLVVAAVMLATAYLPAGMADMGAAGILQVSWIVAPIGLVRGIHAVCERLTRSVRGDERAAGDASDK